MPLTDVEVELVGQDGNAMMIIARVCRALRRAGYKQEANDFANEAMSGDYDNVLQTCFKYVEVT